MGRYTLSWPAYIGSSTDGPLSICALYCTILVHFFPIFVLHFGQVALFPCYTVFMLHPLTLQFLVLHLLHLALFSCCSNCMLHFSFVFCFFHTALFWHYYFLYFTFFMLHFLRVALSSCSTFFVFHFFRVASLYTLFMLNFFRVALFSCCTFFMLHLFHLALFCTVIFSYCNFLCCFNSTLYLFHNAFPSYCTIFILLVFFRVALFLCNALSHVTLLHVPMFLICIFLLLHSYCTFLLLHSVHVSRVIASTSSNIFILQQQLTKPVNIAPKPSISGACWDSIFNVLVLHFFLLHFFHDALF